MTRDKRVDRLTSWDIAATKPVTGFEPRTEGENEGIEFKRENKWFEEMDGSYSMDMSNSDIVNSEPLKFDETVGATVIAEAKYGEPLTLAPVCESITFKSVYPYTINVDNINNMNDVRHIIRLLQIGLTEETAMKLPLHLIKENDN